MLSIALKNGIIMILIIVISHHVLKSLVITDEMYQNRIQTEMFSDTIVNTATDENQIRGQGQGQGLEKENDELFSYLFSKRPNERTDTTDTTGLITQEESTLASNTLYAGYDSNDMYYAL